jgi:UDP-N-acetylglucosamine acyltransferase
MESSTNYIHPTAIIYDNVVMGEHNYIGAYCVIGAPAEHKGNWGTSNDIVVIGDYNVFTGMVTIDGGMENITYIGDNNFFLKKSHLGHDAHVWDNNTISCNAIIGGHSEIGNHCNIGLGAIIHQRVSIPDFVMIGMGGIVTKKSKIESFNIYAGNPVKFIKENIKLIQEHEEHYYRYIQNRKS